MAAAFFNAIADPSRTRGISAGTQPGSRVHPEVVTAMSEVGIDLSGAQPQLLTEALAATAFMVITMGTPFNSEADHTNAGWLFRLLGGNSTAIDPALSRRLRTPPPMRTTSIYSRTDGVVAWQTCRHDQPSSLVHDIEVDSSHIGMGWNRAVLAAVADRLGQPPGPWCRYARAH